MKNKTWKTWTTKELVALEEMRMDGLGAAAIADALGRSLPSVKCRLHAEGIFKPRARLVWLDLLSGPHTIRGVAAALGVSYGTVKQTKRRLRRAGFALPPADRN